MTYRILLALGATAGAALVTAAAALAAPIAVTLRVEGATQTTYEAQVTTDGHNVTTASGGTHKCDGTKGNVNPGPGPTATAALDDGARLGGFTWDGTFDPGLDDYLISRIGPDSQTSSQFWALVVNSQFSQVGGCQQRVRQGDEVLWAFDGFSKQHVLRLSGPASARTGDPIVVRVVDGQNGAPQPGATVRGAVTAGDGRTTVKFDQRGVYRLKAEKPDSVRSNALSVCVDPPGAPPCTSTDKSGPALRVILPGSYASDSSRSRTILVSWQGDDRASGSGVESYDLDAREVNAGAGGAASDWRPIRRHTSLTRAHFRGAAGSAYEFRVTARDRARNSSEATGGPVVIPIDDRDRLVRFSRGWRRLRRPQAWGGSVVRTGRRGASARLRFRGGRVALIGRRLRNGGRLRVVIDGRGRTVRVRGAPRYRQVLFASPRLRPGRHVLRLAAAGRGLVELDALAPAP